MPKGKLLYIRHEDIHKNVIIDVDFLNKYLKSRRRKEDPFFPPSMYIKQFFLLFFVLLCLEKRNGISVQFIIIFYTMLFTNLTMCHYITQAIQNADFSSFMHLTKILQSDVSSSKS